MPVDKPDRRRMRLPSRTAVLLVLLAALAAVALWIVPQLQVAAARDQLSVEDQLTQAERLSLDYNLLQVENAARATLAQILAAGGLLLGLTIVWRRFELSRQLRTSERFGKAIEQLASERTDGAARTEARLGGIYALEHLAAESEREFWPVMEVLTAYVRDNAAWTPPPRDQPPAAGPSRPSADIQVILGVLGRRKPPAYAEGRRLDLRETDLRGANLSGSRLEGVTLQRAHLEHVDATRATLTRSNLREAHLQGAALTHADLEDASLSRANLEGARLNGANLRRADLSGAHLAGADLWDADLRGCNLKDADLRGADLSQCLLEDAILWRADLQDAVLSGAHLRGTHLERANLAGATGLSWEQGEDAYTDENTILPNYLAVPTAQAGAGTAPTGDSRFGPSTPAPTPATRRSPRQVVGPSSGAAQLVRAPAAEPAEPQHQVVQLADVSRRNPAPAPGAGATTEASAERDATADSPKKTALPKHRKPGLVKPA